MKLESFKPSFDNDCVDLLPGEICDQGDIWASCEADVCNEPCQRVGICKDPRHNESKENT